LAMQQVRRLLLKASAPELIRITMTKSDFDFETWFDSLAMMVLDKTGVEFRDQDTVREDYESGRNLADVADQIAAEYGEG